MLVRDVKITVVCTCTLCLEEIAAFDMYVSNSCIPDTVGVDINAIKRHMEERHRPIAPWLLGQ